MLGFLLSVLGCAHYLSVSQSVLRLPRFEELAGGPCFCSLGSRCALPG